MKKFIMGVAVALIAATQIGAIADSHVYTYSDNDGFPLYGALRRVSPNGKWAIGGDDAEFTGTFIINTETPDTYSWSPDGIFLDVDDHGMAVGAEYEVEGYAKYQRAAIYRDGVWTRLPLPESVIGRSYAIAISVDSRLIGGHVMCASESEEDTEMAGGKYYPILWELDDATGKYRVKKVYNDLYVPGTFGFYVYDMSPNGKYICGIQCLNMGDNINVLLDTETGVMQNWHNITFDTIRFQYMGTWYENEVMKVDGVIDEEDTFRGMFTYATDRYIFGSRDVVQDVDEEGQGTILHMATIYDTETETFHDGRSSYSYLCGYNDTENFTTSGIVNYISEDGPFYLSVNDYLEYEAGVENAPRIAGIYDYDNSSKVLTGSHIVDNGLGDWIESPALVILDAPIFIDMTGIADITVDAPANAKVGVSGHTITVSGAENVAVYTAGGTLVSNSSSTVAAPGVYIVVADGVSHKVAIQ